MKRILLMALLTAAAACGELSNDDLVFLNGVPKLQELSVDVEDVESANALIGAPAQSYIDMSATAIETNAKVEQILAFVDTIGKGYPPTKREHDLRVWGPYANVDGGHYTILYEIRRDAATFTYCLFIGRDSDVTGTPTCDDVPGAFGMVAVLHGTYSPTTASGGARRSDGELTLEFEAAFGIGSGTDRGGIHVEHNYDGEGDTKDIAITTDTPQIGLIPALHYAYSYARDNDGRIIMGFSGPLNVVQTSLLLEQTEITACWRDGVAGRASLTVSGGDLGQLQSATAVECWDQNYLQSYWSFTVPDYPILSSSDGDITRCPTPACE